MQCINQEATAGYLSHVTASTARGDIANAVEELCAAVVSDITCGDRTAFGALRDVFCNWITKSVKGEYAWRGEIQSRTQMTLRNWFTMLDELLGCSLHCDEPELRTDNRYNSRTRLRRYLTGLFERNRDVKQWATLSHGSFDSLLLTACTTPLTAIGFDNRYVFGGFARSWTRAYLEKVPTSARSQMLLRYFKDGMLDEVAESPIQFTQQYNRTYAVCQALLTTKEENMVLALLTQLLHASCRSAGSTVTQRCRVAKDLARYLVGRKQYESARKAIESVFGNNVTKFPVGDCATISTEAATFLARAHLGENRNTDALKLLVDGQYLADQCCNSAYAINYYASAIMLFRCDGRPDSATSLIEKLRCS